MQMIFVRATARSASVMAALGAAATLLLTQPTYKLYSLDTTDSDLETVAKNLGGDFLGDVFIHV